MYRVKLLFRYKEGGSVTPDAREGARLDGDICRVRYFSGGEGSDTETLLEAGEGGVLFKITGDYNAEHFFKEGVATKSKMITPYGEIETEIKTEKYSFKEKEGKIKISAEYISSLGGEKSEKSFTLVILPIKEGEK
ncbi:MAG: DUF1934 domain-containing protein [Clostridia bacterium]|nr:DUF1934 domain-containing protein [Clostridia bacterium]